MYTVNVYDKPVVGEIVDGMRNPHIHEFPSGSN